MCDVSNATGYGGEWRRRLEPHDSLHDLSSSIGSRLNASPGKRPLLVYHWSRGYMLESDGMCLETLGFERARRAVIVLPSRLYAPKTQKMRKEARDHHRTPSKSGAR